MRATALLALPLLLLVLPAAPAEASPALPICTTSLIESVSACVGPGACVTVFLGPSGKPICGPPLCTADLIESFGVCQDPSSGCVYGWAGPNPILRLCPVASAAPPGDVCTPTWGIPLTQVQACTTRDASGAACVEVTKDRRTIVLVCDPTTGPAA
jgi:hypothetical protein